MKDKKYMLPDRGLQEILTALLKEKTNIINGVPSDYLGRDSIERALMATAAGIVTADAIVGKNSWVIGRIANHLEETPNDIVVTYLNDFKTDYFRKGAVKDPVPQNELVYAFFQEPEFCSHSAEITVEIYRKRFPKIWKSVEDIIAMAKSDAPDKAEHIYQQLASLYLSKDTGSSVGLLCAVLFSMVQTLQEEFTIPSFCMLDLCSTIHQEESEPSPIEKVVLRLTSGSSNPYSLQKKPGAGLKSYNLAEAVLGVPDVGDSWIVKKYLRKRREALYAALGVTSDTFEQAILQRSTTSKFHREIQGILCEYFHIPSDRLYEAIEKLKQQQGVIAKDLFSDKFVDCYYIIKLRHYLKGLSGQELEAVTTRELIGSICADTIQDDAAFFQNFSLIASLFLLANQFRQDYYSLHSFNDQQAEYHSIGQTYQKELSECKEEIREKDEIIARYKAQEAKREIRKSNASEKPLLAEISSLKNIISKKDDEIDDLKEQLEELSEFCAFLEKDTGDCLLPDQKKIDLSVLKGKKFAFVCNELDATFPGIRKEFPDSIFIEKDTVQGKGRNVDLVIIVTKHISHSIYFKIKKLYRDVPIYPFNRRSLDELKFELAEYFAK